jgi:Tol biopolymer transport system component
VKRLAIGLALFAAGGAAIPTAAGAIVAGPNGPLVFTSGRDDGSTMLSDGRAQIWFLSRPGGSAQRLTTLGLSHHRHASWSPDRTTIAYARGPDDGTPFDGPWDIYVHDLSDPGSAPVNITETLSTNEDRPTWSPDGSRLAYAKQKSGGNWDVVTNNATGRAETTVAQDASAGPGASGQFSRPQWSTDGQAIYYGKIVAATPQDYDIYRASADGSDFILGGTPVVTGNTNDYQPALSADGSTLCFTRQGANKDIYTAPSGGGTGTSLGADGGSTDEYECAWSPDGSKIAFVRGAFGAGQILMKNSDGTGGIDTVTNDTDGPSGTGAKFDGNPEWVRNPSPTCASRTVTVNRNGFVRIPLSCLDEADPPSFAPKDPLDPEIVTPPGNGNIGGIADDKTVVYTPNRDFTGNDSFTFKSNDGTSDSNIGRITINVVPPGGAGGAQDLAAVISGLRVSPRTWRRGRLRPRISFGARARVGTRISFRLSEAARVTLTFARALPGRRVGRRCVRPTPRNRNRRRCTRYRRAASLSFNGRAGSNRIRFQGRLLSGRRIPLGRYRLTVGARDSAGNLSTPRTARFRIVRR